MTLDYRSVFSYRYSSMPIRALFSEKERAATFRRLWLILAHIEKSLGLEISDQALDEMKHNLYNIDLERIHELEEITHHDVMAHILAFGEQCPSANGIIHLGATSCYVTDNADILIYKKALDHILGSFLNLLRLLKDLASQHLTTPCVSYTHFQVAQPTTMGKRFSLWLQDLLHLYLKLKNFAHSMKLLGIKGATGTQSSFDILFDHSEEKLETMESLFEEMLGMKVFALSSQTYTRLQDLELIHIIAELGACFHKIGTDIRLLSHTGELAESFSKHQVGSSAMPHKKNPISSEKLCSLSRFLMQQQQGSAETYATQWLERSLDDSAIRRVIMPDSFLALDECLITLTKIIKGLGINQHTCLTIFENSLKALCLEPILMHLSKMGHDRQKLHEILKDSFMNSTDDFETALESLQTKLGLELDPDFVTCLKDPDFYTSYAVIQTRKFLETFFIA